MARPLRVEYSGAVYHVMSRGNAGQDIFLSSSDRLLFLDTLSDVAAQTGWRVHAYALMKNHYHFLLETPEPNLVAGMKWFQGTYVQRFNRRHQRAGHLYQGRYKAFPVDSGDASYFQKVGTYIHLNPIRAGVVPDESTLAQNALLSSYPHYIDGSSQPDWLDVRRLLSCFQISSDDPAGRHVYRSCLMERVIDVQSDKEDAGADQIRNAGWCYGSDEFRQELISLLDAGGSIPDGVLHGTQRLDHDAARAEQLLRAALLVLDLSEEELLAQRAVCAEKQAVAWLLKKNTTMTVSWVAERLSFGHRMNVSRAIKRFREVDDDPVVIVLKQKMLQCLG